MRLYWEEDVFCENGYYKFLCLETKRNKWSVIKIRQREGNSMLRKNKILKNYEDLLEANSAKKLKISTLKAMYIERAGIAREEGNPIAEEIYTKCSQTLDDVLDILFSDNLASNSKEMIEAVSHVYEDVGEYKR